MCTLKALILGSDEMETEEVGQQEGQLTHDYILKRYSKLFKGIGRSPMHSS